ncbi:uncharacterized protein M421DRAFT_2909 [Didymella exigua CBS 183.55]|uniref:Nuclear membrane fusion protein Kar5 n=1 Tax=Didymella exigua CBS 183.55 TaxID=1150837 RepID=A0A6A5RW61_9PLEO|nr:uncharacterized protein M421DRAFT_2909 [Didymella exigua CBS 183.55]KAF1931414.1 hypothetical protein M421DRAFT_2909 [Didymella exigua CBS 183.55]
MKLTTAVPTGVLLHIPATLSYYHSPSADAAPTANIDSLFRYTNSRNQKVISQAVDFVVSMQTAPACTRMAASHLMNECKLLEHAPDFAKNRPQAYLDNVKTEYAAKLAVCELLSAQPPNNAIPPLHCDILVPSSRACNKGGWWSQAPTNTDRHCYPEHKEYQYSQCLKTLQSSPQYWTSFSNARQNAVVMCQASRDAIERENHLDIFKNWTQVMSAVSSSIQHTAEEYTSLLQEQKQFVDKLREAQSQFEKDASAVQDRALATAGNLDDKFHTFIETSISELITALATGQSAEIARVREELQVFSQDMIAENSQLAKSLTTELQQHHDRAIISLQINHQAQVESHEVLSGYMGDITTAATKINETADASLTKIGNIEHRLDNLSSKAEHIARGFAFFSSLPQLITSLIRGLVATVGALFIFIVLYHFSRRLASYTAGACSAAYLLHLCGVYEFIAHLPTSISGSDSPLPFNNRIDNLNATQKGVGVVMVLWLATYPVSCVSNIINTLFLRIISSYWVRQYSNDGGRGLLPSIEIPRAILPRRLDNLEKHIWTGHHHRPGQDASHAVAPR